MRTDETASPSLHEDVTADLRANRGLTVVVVVAVLGWLAFQWGFGNDVLLPTITARVYNALENPPDWMPGIVAVVAAAAIGGLFWATTQLLDAVIVLAGLRLLPRITERFGRWLNSKGWIAPYSEMSLLTKWSIAYAAGASVVCLVDALATGEPGISNRKAMIGQSVALSAGSITMVILVVAATTMAAQRNEILEPAAQLIARYAANPLTWIVLIGLVLMLGHLRTRWADRHET